MGGAGDKEAEAESIFLQYDIPYGAFSAAGLFIRFVVVFFLMSCVVMKCLPPVGWTAENDKPWINRRDLRNLEVCSVDPPGKLYN